MISQNLKNSTWSSNLRDPSIELIRRRLAVLEVHQKCSHLSNSVRREIFLLRKRSRPGGWNSISSEEKFQIKKRNRWHHLFSLHASRILKFNQNILICSLGRRYLPSTNFNLELIYLLAESLLAGCTQKRPEVGNDLSSWTISCSRNECQSKSNCFRRQERQG